MAQLRRSIFLLTILIWSACPLFGQIVLTPKSADGLYRAGENAVWTVTSAQGSGAASATYSARKNGAGSPFKQGTLDLSSGSATIELTLDEPGAILLTVRPQADPATAADSEEGTASTRDGRGRGGLGGRAPRDGAIIDAEHLKPSLPRPDDFDAWWSKKLEALDAIPANPKLDKVDVNIAGIEYYKVTLDNIDGTHVQGQLAKPAKEGKFPAILQLQYAGVYPLQRQWVTGRAKAGWLALNVLAHDMPIDDRTAIQQLANGALRNYQAIGNADREESYFLRMYLGDCRALEYLASRPDWDGRTLVVMGDSMGGQQSLTTVGLVGEKLKVTHMICHVPSGCDVGAQSNSRAMAYPNWPNQPQVIQTARYFDPVNFAPRIKATTLISVGLYDGTSPPVGVIAAFNLITGPKELLGLHSDHGGPGQQPREARREEWLSALVKGESVTLKK